MSRAMMYSKIDGWEGNANVAQNLASIIWCRHAKVYNRDSVMVGCSQSIAFHYWNNKVL